METNLPKDFKAKIDALVKLYGERVRETGWSNSLTGVVGHYKKGIEDGYRLGLESCEGEVAQLKEQVLQTSNSWLKSSQEKDGQLKAKDEEIAKLKKGWAVDKASLKLYFELVKSNNLLSP